MNFQKDYKRILITGKNSYIGNNFIDWIEKRNDKFLINKISVRSGSLWENHDFSKYDVIIHLAGIAHVSTNPKYEKLYHEINHDLAYKVAEKARNENVQQFIFMSSIIVYGNNSEVIGHDTAPMPSNFYGASKLNAEKSLLSLESEDFKIVILRPPMIYGKGCKGNYQKLSKIARSLPFFPKINNRRSMLYIENLCEFIRLMIVNEERGLYFPQNSEYINTSELVKLIAKVAGKKIRLTSIFNPLFQILSNRIGVINKAFGNLAYERTLSDYKEEYNIINLEDSILITEGREL